MADSTLNKKLRDKEDENRYANSQKSEPCAEGIERGGTVEDT